MVVRLDICKMIQNTMRIYPQMNQLCLWVGQPVVVDERVDFFRIKIEKTVFAFIKLKLMLLLYLSLKVRKSTIRK